MNRRTFLKTAATGISAVVLDSVSRHWMLPKAKASTDRTILRLEITEALVEMVDLTPVYHWTFADESGPRFPGPLLVVTEGDRVDILVSNRLPQDHAFDIPGVARASTGVIRPGQDRMVKLVAPPAGTYLYEDPLNAPLNRVMGLHGVMISLPRFGNTPYTSPTVAVQQLFNAFGTHPALPGHPWHVEDSRVWVFTQIDPDLNQRVRIGNVTSGAQFATLFQPRYFTINGRSGYFAAHAHDTYLHSTVGHPHLIRNVNAGIWGHSPHTHANHVYMLSVNGQVRENVWLVDTWTISPRDRIDVIYPFVMPPDIPPQTWAKVIDGTHEEPFPMLYPMHCHQEVSNTAAGGNYPQGNVTHIDFLGPLDQVAGPGNPPAGYPRGGDDSGGDDDDGGHHGH